MIVIRQKEFNSKAQKARRRNWDIQQGKDVVETWNNNSIDPSARFHERADPKKSNAQFKMLGEEKTKELIDEATKKNRSSKSKGGLFGLSKGPRQYVGVSNQKEAEKLKQAEDIVALGRERSRMSASHEDALLDKNSAAYKKAKKNRNNLNDIINSGEGGTTRMEEYKYTTEDNIKKAVEHSKATNPSEVKKSIAKHEAKAAELRAKKVAGQKLVKNLKTAGKVGIGVAGAAGIGYGIKKAVDKNKKENGKEK